MKQKHFFIFQREYREMTLEVLFPDQLPVCIPYLDHSSPVEFLRKLFRLGKELFLFFC